MATRRVFSPGFRLSTIDILVLAAGVVGAGVLGMFVGWLGFAVAFTIGHFFLFCNVFRLSRPLELAWAACFISLSAATIVLEFPGWMWTGAISLLATAAVVAIEMRRPSYHGVGWRRINPHLEIWWNTQTETTPPPGT